MKFDIVCAKIEDLARAKWRETEETRYKIVAIDRYRVPRTAALVDPSCLRTRQKNQNKIPHRLLILLLLLRAASDPAAIFFRVCTYRFPRPLSLLPT